MLSWLEQTALAEAIRTTPWAYSTIEIVHLLGIAALVGPAMAFDLRLLGAGRAVLPVTTAARHLLPLARAGFAVAALSGCALFVSGAIEVAGSDAMPAKLALLGVAGANVALFHLGIYRTVARWDTDRPPPARARVAGAVSITTWAGVIACGRLIAYT
jgi:hypothetical protein